MEKFNAIKMLEKEQEKENLVNTNSGKEDFYNKLFAYIEDYIEPYLIGLNNKGLLQYDTKSEDEEIIAKTTELEILTKELLEHLAFGYEIKDNEMIVDYDNSSKYEDFIFGDKKIKTEVANMFKRYIEIRFLK